MKDYIIAWVVTIVLTIGGLFGVGFAVGVLMAITGNAREAQHLEQAAWFNILVLISMPIINFIAFKFATKKFLVNE